MSSFLGSMTNSASGSRLELADALEVALHLLALALEPHALLLGQRRLGVVEAALGVLQPLDRRADGDEVGERAAQPAVGDVVLAAARRLFGDDVLRLALGADEEHAPAGAAEPADEVRRLLEELLGLLQVDDVDAVALAEDVRLHLRVPAPRLVPEVDPRFEHLLHADFDQGRSPLPLAELEALAGAGLSVLLAFLLAGVAGQEPGRLEALAQLAVELEQGARDAVADGARLAACRRRPRRWP